MMSYKADKWVIAAGLTAMLCGVMTAFCAGSRPAKAEEVKSARRFVPLREDLVLTSRVNADDLGWDDKMELGYDGIAGDQICRTKLREYCVEEGNCDWYVDYYIAKAPRVCPVEPIE